MDININVDITPPLPNIYTSYDKYNIKDKINNTFNIPADSTIFIFNLDSSIDTKYNNPEYMLYGVTFEEEYKIPPIRYYSYNVDGVNYEEISTSDIMTEDIKTILTLVGYTDNITVPDDTTFYRYLKVYDFNKKVTSFVYYLYFYSDGAQINNYNKYIYYNNALINVYIYPYVNEFVFTKVEPIDKNVVNIEPVSCKYENLNFDNIELCSYNNKLDFTYFKNNVNIPKLKVLSVYNKYIKRYKLVDGINVSTHELNITNTNDNIEVGNSTNIQFKNEYNKKNKNYNNSWQLNSITYNNKLAYINSKNNNTASNNTLNTYALFNNNIISTYKIIENYTINSYFDIANPDVYDKNFEVANNYLRKILILIDQQIINPDYVPTINIKIENILNNKNELDIVLNDTINIVKKDTSDYVYTNTYYIDRYKITFQDSYIILLNIAYYNSSNIYINDVYSITNYNSLGYINLTFLNKTFYMYPSLTNTFNNNDILTIYEDYYNFEFLNTTHYSYIINYNKNYDNISGGGGGGSGVSSGIKYKVNNFSSYVSNIVSPPGNNYFDVLTQKVNNFIEDVITTSFYYFGYTKSIYDTDSLLLFYYTFDNKIDISLINYYDYNPDIEGGGGEDTGTSDIQYLPVGFYKVFFYTNSSPLYDFIDQSEENDIINDEIIISAKEYIYNILFVNCCLLIKIDTITEFYLAVCNINREIYVQTTGKIAVVKLFDYFNGDSDNPIPLSMNLIFNNYFNFCTLTVITEQFTYFDASNTLRIKNIEVSTYPFDSEIYNYDEVCYGGGSSSFIGSGGGLVNINKYDECSVIIIFTIFIYLKRAYYYSKLQFDNLNISRILSINVLDRYINIIYPLITSDNVNDIIKAIQIISTAFINVSDSSEFQSLRNTYKIFIELERSILLLKEQVSDINELYTVLLYLYTPEINYGYIITPENEEIINGNIYIEDDNQEKDFIITNINEITEPDLLEYIQIIDKIFIEQDSYEINAIINNVVSDGGGDGGGDIRSKLKNIVSKGSGGGSKGSGGGSKGSGGGSKGSGGGSNIKINSINKFSNKLNKDNNKKQNKMFNKKMGKDKSMHCKNKSMHCKNKGIYSKNKRNGDKYIDNSYDVYISSLLYSNGMVYVYDYLTNDITLLLYGNESSIDIYNNAYIDLIKIVLTNDILE
jgi:uncharacterized membrane protein YgcG